MSPAPALLALDWGTTNLRAYALDAAGGVVARADLPRGLTSTDAPHADTLEEVARALGAGAGVPALLAGMVGARGGWAEAPYVAVPGSLDRLAAGLVPAPGARRRALIVPGLSVPGLASAAGPAPDVMRGEEVKLLGLVAAGTIADGVVVTPGTHPKWTRLEGGGVAAFRTFMTGEAFAALGGHTILGRLMAPPGADAAAEAAGFARGLEAAAGARGEGPGGLLHLLFSVRTLGLFEALPATALRGYLSGLLIGAEVDAGLAGEAPGAPVALVGEPALVARYAAALASRGVAPISAPADAAARGLAAVARAAGLLGPGAAGR